MILEWYLLFKIIIKICKKMFKFCEKLPKAVYSIFLYFLFNWKGVNPSITSEEIYRKWDFLLYLSKTNKTIGAKI